jgi:mono/diheme cytochrome c family protein
MNKTAILALAGALGTQAVGADEISKEQIEFFEKKIRPVLSENCYKCHSVEQGKSRGNFTLDTRDGIRKGGENGAAVVLGDPAKSPLITSIKTEDEDAVMPPKKENKKLTAQQIADLEEWIRMGAPDPRIGPGKKLSGLTPEARAHWAYQAVKKPEAPKVKNRAWAFTPLDNFILAKIEEKGMAPSPIADKETILRRATYDLIGLPPEPKDIEDFLKDESPYAFAKVIDRLLSSPHYGERWGRYWLDTARYSDTTGDRQNNRVEDYRYPYAWTYRDYVIRSFNEDKPYDRFVVEQIAADQLTDLKDPRSIAALGFLTVGQRSNNKNDIIDDRIDTVTKGFLAMTVSCARCHDHKFDPIPTTDYYSLHGIFSSTEEPDEKPVIAQSDKASAAEFGKQMAKLELENLNNYYSVAGKYNRMFRENAGAYIAAAELGGRMSSEKDQRLSSELIGKYNLNQDILRGLRGSLRRHPNIFGPFNAYLDGKWDEIGSGKKTGLNSIVGAALLDIKPKDLGELMELYTRIFTSVNIKAAEFIRANSESASAADKIPTEASVVELLQIPLRINPAHLLTMEKLEDEVQGWPLGLRNRGWVFAKINDLKMTGKGGDARAMVVMDSRRPKNSPVFIRGQADTHGEEVPRRFLEVLSGGDPKPFKLGSGRLELARSIADKKNPLTARVIANRVWMHHFGEGLVRTPDDLGTMAEKPTHPELLDYLADYLMEQGWSLKKLHKLIMLSKVYQESSYTVAAHEQVDPGNRLLWRANVRRLDFESIRDSLLTFSGKLEPILGGQPVNITDEPYSFRRSVYGYVDRGNLPELMAAFDFSNPQAPNSKRVATIVPQQALYLMNSAMAVDVARSVMERPEVVNSRDNLNKIFNIYRIVLQRAPRREEIQMALEFVGFEKREEPQVLAAAKPMVEKGMKKVEEMKRQMERESNNRLAAVRNKESQFVERKPLTAWETCVHALLMSNEVVYVN